MKVIMIISYTDIASPRLATRPGALWSTNAVYVRTEAPTRVLSENSHRFHFWVAHRYLSINCIYLQGLSLSSLPIQKPLYRLKSRRQRPLCRQPLASAFTAQLFVKSFHKVL